MGLLPTHQFQLSAYRCSGADLRHSLFFDQHSGESSAHAFQHQFEHSYYILYVLAPQLETAALLKSNGEEKSLRAGKDMKKNKCSIKRK